MVVPQISKWGPQVTCERSEQKKNGALQNYRILRLCVMRISVF